MTLDKFQPSFMALCEMFNKKDISAEVVKLYFLTLDGAGMTDEEFQKAVSHILTTRKYTSLPMPAEILESVKGDPDAQAMFAIEQLEKAISNHGAYESVTFQDGIIGDLVTGFEGGWVGLCELPIDEWKWVKKDFVKMYKARMSTGQFTKEPVKLVGRHEASGNTNIKPVLIGGNGDVKLIESNQMPQIATKEGGDMPEEVKKALEKFEKSNIEPFNT